MKHIFTSLFAAAFLLLSAKSYAQVTITSSDSITCTNLCTTLTAHLIGDIPIDAGIRIDDQYPAAYNPIGFTFYFYGFPYTQCLIGPNGTICFNPGLTGAFETWVATGPLLGQVPVENSICGPWCDIDVADRPYPTAGTITYSTDGVAPNRRFSITFCKAAMYSCTTQYINTQMILYETSNLVEVHVGHKDICTSWYGTIPGLALLGVENAAGTLATAAPGRDYPSVYTCTDEGWRFTPYVLPIDSIVGTDSISYHVASIAYAPIPYDSSIIYWYNATTGAYIDTGISIIVCPTATTTYKAGALGCSDTSFGYFTVNVAPTISAAIAATTNPSHCGACDGIMVISGLTPGIVDTINYSLAGVPQPPFIATVSSGGTMTLTGLCAGAYSDITAKQATCVSAPMSVTLVNPPISISSLTPTNVDSCGGHNGSIVLNGLYPDYTFTVNYTLNGITQPPVIATSTTAGTITLSRLTVGVYANIIASYGTACATPPAGPMTLTGPPPPIINLTGSANPSQCGYCDGNITIQYVASYASDTVFYSFNGVVQTPFLNIAEPDGSVYIPGLCAGNYSDFTVKVGECPATVLGSAFLVAPPIIDSFGYINHFGCNGDTVMFINKSSSPGALFYVWNFGDGATDTNANPMHIYAQGVYTITLKADNNVCDTTFSMSDSLEHPLHAGFVDTPFVYCQNAPVTLTNITNSLNSGTLTYEWLFGDGSSDTTFNTVHTYPKTGTYTVQLIATNFVPCNDTASLIVSIDSSSGLGLIVTDSVLCKSSSVTFKGIYSDIGNVGITWYFGDGDSIMNVNPVVHSFDGVGTFTVTATARYRKCDDTSASKSFTIYPGPGINLGPDTSICAGSAPLVLSDQINATTKGATWLWNTGQTTPSITVTAPGHYEATVDIDGCYATDTVWVSNDCYMEIPNVFTPNGDGINDYFYPMQYLSKGVTSFKMDIYNRWGQLLFEGTALDGRGWDGKFNGVDQPEGVYVYVLDAVFKDGQKEHHQGNVTVLR